MIQITNKRNCSGCGACANICPQKCISMVTDSEGFLYPKIDDLKCINCGLCEKICPVKNAKEDVFSVPECYACFSNDEDVLKNSSSGGIFAMLAEKVLITGGVVYGAAYKNAFVVTHKKIETKDKLKDLQTSKYIQSETLEIFGEVKKDLESKKQVLFSGTACQIAGLKSYLQKDYKNLVSVDVICHGVPSQKVWQKYLEELGFSDDAKVNFRNKENGWLNYQMKIEENEKVFVETHKKNKFMKTFLCDANLRPSCYDCKFKTLSRVSDLTLADFWGVQNTLPEMFNKKGTSAVFVHTNKGREFFESVKGNITQEKVSFDDAVRNNKSFLFSAKEHKNRAKFFNNLDGMKISKLSKKYFELNLFKKCKIKIKKIAKNILKKLKIM